MSDARPPKPATRRELRTFGLVVGGVLVALSSLVPLARHRPAHPIALAVGLVLCVLGLAFPQALRVPQRVWDVVGRAIGAVQLRIMLTVLFVVVVLPVGLVRRALGLPVMSRRAPRESYRVPSVPRRRETLEEPF